MQNRFLTEDELLAWTLGLLPVEKKNRLASTRVVPNFYSMSTAERRQEYVQYKQWLTDARAFPKSAAVDQLGGFRVFFDADVLQEAGSVYLLVNVTNRELLLAAVTERVNARCAALCGPERVDAEGLLRPCIRWFWDTHEVSFDQTGAAVSVRPEGILCRRVYKQQLFPFSSPASFVERLALAQAMDTLWPELRILGFHRDQNSTDFILNL